MGAGGSDSPPAERTSVARRCGERGTLSQNDANSDREPHQPPVASFQLPAERMPLRETTNHTNPRENRFVLIRVIRSFLTY